MRRSRMLLYAASVALTGCNGAVSQEGGAGEEQQTAASASEATAATPPNLPPNWIGSLESDGKTCSDNFPNKQVFWGDLHDHTRYSLDSIGFLNQRVPEEAYDFASGVYDTRNANAALGTPRQIDRPLDFVVVSDHAEYIGAAEACFAVDGQKGSDYGTPDCRALQQQVQQGWSASDMLNQMFSLYCPEGLTSCMSQHLPQIMIDDPTGIATAQKNVWQKELQAADRHNVPCEFTTLPAYEWTAAPNKDVMHHIVLFNGQNTPQVPFDYLNYPTESSLLAALQSNCTGACDAITIQHNPNLSNGNAWSISPADHAKPGDSAFYALRALYEKMVEIHQSKGSSECVPLDSQDGDPECNFELSLGPINSTTTVAQLEAAQGPGYVRAGLNQGLSQVAAGNANAYQLGFVGGTDNHQATPGYTNEAANQYEAQWNGSVGAADDTPAERLGMDIAGNRVNSGGLTGLWATQNTRDNIFKALKAREAYATSGTRIQLRFYETWDTTTPSFCKDPNMVADLEKEAANGNGALMGGVMPPPPSPNAKPRFVVWAQQDPHSAYLDKVEIVRGSYAQNAIGGGTATVAVPNGAAANELPDKTAQTCLDLTDSGFNAALPTYYYARVLEQPTDRWSVADCGKDPTDCAKVPAAAGFNDNVKIQERAWGSPVWFKPAK